MSDEKLNLRTQQCNNCSCQDTNHPIIDIPTSAAINAMHWKDTNLIQWILIIQLLLALLIQWMLNIACPIDPLDAKYCLPY